MKTTLNKIRAHGPCGIDPRDTPLAGYQKLVAAMGAGYSPNAPITITQILDSNGLDDALWCLRAVDGYEREIRLFSAKQARKVQHLNTDPRVEACLKAAEDFANGLITFRQLEAAGATARTAARTAAEAAAWSASAGAAAWAAWSAAWSAAGAAAWSAAEAARAAARTAAGAAREAEREAQAKDLRQLCKDCK
jgi:hypothetical protein